MAILQVWVRGGSPAVDQLSAAPLHNRHLDDPELTGKISGLMTLDDPRQFLLLLEMLVASLMIGCSHSVEGLRPVFPLHLLVDRDGRHGFSANSIVLRQRQAMASHPSIIDISRSLIYCPSSVYQFSIKKPSTVRRRYFVAIL